MIQINASIVLYHNRKDQILKTIKSFLNTDLNVELYLIDNSLNDELKKLICIDERVKYIFNNANLGYGRAHNIAIRKSIDEDVKYHLVLNPDVYFNRGVLEKIYQYMESHPYVGNLMPKVLYPNGSIQYLCKLLPTPIDLISRKFFPFKRWEDIPELLKSSAERRIGSLVLKDVLGVGIMDPSSKTPNHDQKWKGKREDYELRLSGYDKIMNVPSLSGCFMFSKTNALKDVGIFDERFFMYLEDTDLNRRLHAKYNTIFYPEVSVYHEYAKESYKSKELLIYHIESAIYYFNKWGWFFDSERTKFNKRILEYLSLNP